MPDIKQIIAIGDIHGCAESSKTLLTKLDDQ